MAIRHYVLLATDGFIELPKSPDLCNPPRERVYVFGFTGGLLSVDGNIIKENAYLDFNKSENWPGLMCLKGTATIPSPMVWAEVGDQLYITLINLGMKYRSDIKDFHTVHMHGAHVPTQMDGFPEASFGVPMWEDTTPLKKPPMATYLFQPEHPGTLMYHCHVEASEHVQMGMYGALIIYPSMESLAEAGITRCESCNSWMLDGHHCRHIPKSATNRNFAYNNIHSYFDKEYVMLLSDIDTAWHESVLHPQDPQTFFAYDFKPTYWLVNGRAFPDTLFQHPQTPLQGSDPNLTQINYDSYVHVKTNESFLLRMINMGYQVVPWHIHGWHFMVLGKDAHISPWLKRAAANMTLDHEQTEMGFTATIGSGETYDIRITADDKRPLYRKYIVHGQDGFDSFCKQIRALDPAAIADIPTEPVHCPNQRLVNYVDICSSKDPSNDKYFPQFYPMHNHDDYKVTNKGVYPGGQLTFIQTDAPASDEDKQS